MATAALGSDAAAMLREWRRLRRYSQLDLALRAGTTQRHVSFIETGRSVPGRSVLVRLCEALAVPLRERNAILLAAGYAPAYGAAGLDAEDLRAVRDALAADAVCDRIAATGALEEARSRALAVVGEAKAGLVGLDLDDGQRRALELVADSVADRYA